MRHPLFALLAGAFFLPVSALASVVPVCDGTPTVVGPDGSGNYSVVCDVAWRMIDEPFPSWLAQLSISQVGDLAVSMLLLWSCAFLLRVCRHALSV